MRDLLRGGVGTLLGYAPSGACVFPASARRRPTGSDRRGTGARGAGPNAPHSMQYASSFVLEYARSACWGDCGSIMLCEARVTLGDLVQAGDMVSAGSDG